MSISSISGSSSAGGTAQAELLKAQQKLAADTAAKAAAKVLTEDKAAVAKAQKESTPQRSSTGSVDLEL